MCTKVPISWSKLPVSAPMTASPVVGPHCLGTTRGYKPAWCTAAPRMTTLGNHGPVPTRTVRPQCIHQPPQAALAPPALSSRTTLACSSATRRRAWMECSLNCPCLTKSRWLRSGRSCGCDGSCLCSEAGEGTRTLDIQLKTCRNASVRMLRLSGKSIPLNRIIARSSASLRPGPLGRSTDGLLNSRSRLWSIDAAWISC